MSRTFVCLALLLLAGCQNPAWQNPYAMIGPATVPPPGAQGSAGTYYASAPDAAKTKEKSPGGTIRSEIADGAKPPRAAATSSFPATRPSDEPPIRIVEAAPAAKPQSTPVKTAVPAPIKEPSQPATKTSQPPTSAVRRDPAVTPAGFQAGVPTFVETRISDARGQWRLR